MQFAELLKWNRRFSVLYAAGVWTMIGSYGFYRYTGRFDERPVEVIEEPKDENQVEFRTPHTKTLIVYKKDFVPYTTRIYNFLQSFGEAPPPPPPEQADAKP